MFFPTRRPVEWSNLRNISHLLMITHSSGFSRRIDRLLRKTNGLNTLRESHRLAQSQQCNVVIVSVLIEISVANNCAHSSLNRLSFGCHKLIMISEYHANFAALQSPHTMSRLINKNIPQITHSEGRFNLHYYLLWVRSLPWVMSRRNEIAHRIPAYERKINTFSLSTPN